MKYITFLFLFLFSNINFAQTKLIGKVLIQNSGKKPLSGVQITGSNGKIVYSRTDGTFEIPFFNQEKGDYVSLKANFNGYKIINEHLLNNIGINPNFQIDIIMCQPEELDKRRAEFYSIYQQYPMARYQKTLDEQIRQNKSIEKSLNIARQELNIVNLAMDRFAEWYATFNIDFAGNTDKEYYDLLKEGKIDSLELEDIKDRELKEYKLLLKQKATITQALEGNNVQIDTKRGIFESISEAFIIKGDISNAKKTYYDIIDLDSNNFYLAFKFAQLLQGFLEMDNSIAMYNKATEKSDNNPDSVRCLLSIGYVYLGMGKISLAKKYFFEAEKIDNKSNIGYSINITKGIANLYRKQFQYDSTNIYYNEVINLLKSNKDDKDFRKFAARSYCEMGEYFSARLLYKQSFESFENTEQIYNSIFEKDSDDKKYINEMKREYAQFLGIRGDEYFKRKRIEESKIFFNKSDSVLIDLIEKEDFISTAILSINWFTKSMNLLLSGNVTESNIFQSKIDSLQTKLHGEVFNVMGGLQNTLKNLSSYYTSTVDTAFLFHYVPDSASASILKNLGEELLPIIERLNYTKNYNLTGQDSLNRIEELRNLSAYLLDSLNHDIFVKKDDLSNTILILSNSWFEIGDVNMGFYCLFKSYIITKTLTENDKIGYQFYPDLGNIFSLLSRRYLQNNNIDLSIFTVDSLVTINKQLSYIDSVQFACDLSESYLQKADCFGVAQLNNFKNEGWYDYAIADSICLCINNAEKCADNCHDQLMNRNLFLQYRLLIEKANAMISKGYSTGSFPTEQKLEVEDLIKKIKVFNPQGNQFINPIQDVISIENMFNNATDTVLKIGKIYYQSQHCINNANSTLSYSKNIDLLLNAEKILEQGFRSYPQEINFIEKKVVVFTNLSWNYLFLKKFKDSEKCALKSLETNHSPENLVPYTNLGHSYLYRGRFSNALISYENLKGKEDENGKKYKIILLEDFIALENAGVSHPDVEKMKVKIQQW